MDLLLIYLAMEPFFNLPWWALAVFLAVNAYVVFILVILIRQVLGTHKSQISNFLEKRKTKLADGRRKEYSVDHRSSYVDA